MVTCGPEEPLVGDQASVPVRGVSIEGRGCSHVQSPPRWQLMVGVWGWQMTRSHACYWSCAR